MYVYISKTYGLFVVTPSFTSWDDLQTTYMYIYVIFKNRVGVLYRDLKHKAIAE